MEILAEFEKFLININAPLLYTLNGGLTNGEIHKLELEYGFELLPEIRDLYKWKNGSHVNYDKTLGDRHFFNGAMLMSLDRAFLEYKIFIENEMAYYLPSYFLMFESMGEEFFVIDTDPQSETFKMILSYRVKHVFMTDGPFPVYDSLETMFQSIMKCYSEEAYFFRRRNEFEVDFGLERDIIDELNPKTKYLRPLE